MNAARPIRALDIPEAEFLRYVNKGESCWVWTACRNRQGYGHFRGYFAHRISYALFNGPIRRGVFVRHRCDNPSCVRPDHLELGSRRDNSHDALKRGRTGSRFGTLVIAEMARLKRLGAPSANACNLFGVSQGYFDELARGTYRPVTNRFSALDPARGMPSAGPCKACSTTGVYALGFRKSGTCAACNGTGHYIPGGCK